MLRAGVDVVRLNLSHGHLDEHIARLHAVREAAERTGSVVAVLADLPGPKVRAAPFPGNGVDAASRVDGDVGDGGGVEFGIADRRRLRHAARTTSTAATGS